jgi:hypothetical protein
MTKKFVIPAPTDHHHIYDLRLQERFVAKALWLAPAVAAKIESVEDVESLTTGFKEEQPAIGAFSAEYLARVQKNFPYKR